MLFRSATWGGKKKYDGESEKIESGYDKKKHLYKGHDLGFGIGVGVQYKLFRADIGYNFGLTDITTSDYFKMQNTGLAITLVMIGPIVK